MQANQYSQAISFANGYFALVDGLACGLEDYLVEDVRLEWFGRVIKGRKNVAAFMRNHMANSRHIFTEIMPIANIGSEICKIPRRRCKLETNLTDTTKNVTNNIVPNDLSFSSLRFEEKTVNEKEEMNLDFNDGDIKSILLDEATPNHSKAIINVSKKVKNHVSDNNTSVFDKSFMKFVESKGIVQFDRRCSPNRIGKWRPTAFNSSQFAHEWRRRCILKIAYSTRFHRSTKSEENLTKVNIFGAGNDDTVSMDCEENKKRECSYTPQRRKRLKSSDDILGLKANVDTNEVFHCLDEKKRFLEFFETEMSASDPKFDLTTPKYVGNRLVFDAAEKMNPQCNEYLKSFKFDYLIHTIVYESNIECKLNLSEEFEKQEIVELS